MEAFVEEAASDIALLLDAVAILMVALGAVISLAKIARMLWERRVQEAQVRTVFIGFARWLVAALTFQLGADIVSTTTVPSWDAVGQLAAIAVIRTFLTYFLDRDLERAEAHAEARRKTEPDAGSRAS